MAKITVEEAIHIWLKSKPEMIKHQDMDIDSVQFTSCGSDQSESGTWWPGEIEATVWPKRGKRITIHLGSDYDLDLIIREALEIMEKHG